MVKEGGEEGRGSWLGLVISYPRSVLVVIVVTVDAVTSARRSLPSSLAICATIWSQRESSAVRRTP